MKYQTQKDPGWIRYRFGMSKIVKDSFYRILRRLLRDLYRCTSNQGRRTHSPKCTACVLYPFKQQPLFKRKNRLATSFFRVGESYSVRLTAGTASRAATAANVLYINRHRVCREHLRDIAGQAFFLVSWQKKLHTATIRAGESIHGRALPKRAPNRDMYHAVASAPVL